MNNIKTFMLLALLTAGFVWVGGMLGGRSGMITALVITVVMNFSAYWFSDKMVLAMYRAKEASEADAPELYSIVRRLASKAGMPMPRVYIMNAAQPNAFATGRNPEHAAVAVTSGIMQMLDPDELAGVIAHELSHIRHRDILIGTIAATIAGAISFIARMALFFGGGDDRDRNPVLAIIILIFAPIAALIVQLMISRSREFEADRGGADLAGNPMYLANALRKLGLASQKVPMNANPATSHMFIVNPLRGGGITKLFSTHPDMNERIRRLEEMRLSR